MSVSLVQRDAGPSLFPPKKSFTAAPAFSFHRVSHNSLEDSHGFTQVGFRQLRSKSVDNTGRDLVSASVVVDRGEALLMQLREMEASDARGTAVAATGDENGKSSAYDGHLVTGARPVVDGPVGGTAVQDCAPSAGPAPVLDPGPVAELKGDTDQPTKHPSAQAILLPQGEILSTSKCSGA